jgi:hypothetical protein
MNNPTSGRGDTLRCRPMRPGDDQAQTTRSTRRLLTVPEAAEELGLTVDAVRSRIKRGTIPKEKAPDGSVFVVVEPNPTAQARPVNDHDNDQHAQANAQANARAGAQAMIIARLEDEVSFLRRQLEHRDHLLAAALERIPQIEPPQDSSREAREGDLRGTEGQGSGDVPPEQERRSWWQRWFGA